MSKSTKSIIVTGSTRRKYFVEIETIIKKKDGTKYMETTEIVAKFDFAKDANEYAEKYAKRHHMKVSEYVAQRRFGEVKL